MLLALDTSTSLASIALALPASAGDDARLVAETTWQVGQRHSTELLERLDGLMAASHLGMDDLTGVAVALGPGSFNGVRVALATAKSLAFARAVPLYGVPTLDIIAWGHRGAVGTICAILEAGRGQVYAAIYDGTNDGTIDGGQPDAIRWAPRDGYAVRTVAELAGQIERTTGGAFFCGEMSPQTRTSLAEALGDRFRAASSLEVRRGGRLAELALARAAQQRYDEPIALEPLYLRRPAITTSTRRGVSAPEGAGDGDKRDDAPKGEGTSDALRR